MLPGIHFVVGEGGEKVAVQIDLKRYGDLWEDIYDTLLARSRENEPRESLDAVKELFIRSGKLDE
jgi:hypothetical protein